MQTTTKADPSPVPGRPCIDMDKIGTGIIPHTTTIERKSGAADPAQIHARYPDIHGLTRHMQTLLGDPAALAT